MITWGKYFKFTPSHTECFIIPPKHRPKLCAMAHFVHSFTMSTSNLPATAKVQDGVRDKEIAVTGMRIQCPAVIQGGIEMTEGLSCRIEVQQGGQGMTSSVKPHDRTDVSISPPLVKPSGSTKDFRISVEVWGVWLIFFVINWAKQSRLPNINGSVVVDCADKFVPWAGTRITGARDTFAIHKGPLGIWFRGGRALQ